MVHPESDGFIEHRKQHVADLLAEHLGEPNRALLPAGPWKASGPGESRRYGDETLQRFWVEVLPALVRGDLTMKDATQLAAYTDFHYKLVRAAFNQGPSAAGLFSPVTTAIVAAITDALHCERCSPADPQALIVATPTIPCNGTQRRDTAAKEFGLPRNGDQRFSVPFATSVHVSGGYSIGLQGTLMPVSHDRTDDAGTVDRLAAENRGLAHRDLQGYQMRALGTAASIFNRQRGHDRGEVATIITEGREEDTGADGTTTSPFGESWTEEEGWDRRILEHTHRTPTLVEAGDGRAGGGGLNHVIRFVGDDGVERSAKEVFDATCRKPGWLLREGRDMITLTDDDDDAPEIWMLKGWAYDVRRPRGTRRVRSLCFVAPSEAHDNRFFLMPVAERVFDFDMIRAAVLRGFRALLLPNAHVGPCRRNAHLGRTHVGNVMKQAAPRETTFDCGNAIRFTRIALPGQ